MPLPSADSSIESPSITQLKPAKKLNVMFQSSPLAMIEWTDELIIVGWNAAAAELFSFFEEEALGQRIDQLLAKRQIADVGADTGLDSWMSCERAGVLREHVGLNGKQLCRWFNTPFQLKGQRIGTLSTIVKVSEGDGLSHEELRSQIQQLKATLKNLQHAQLNLVQTEKMSSLGQLVAGIAHEINNPVNFIHGNLSHITAYTQDLLKLIRLYQAHYPTPNSTIQALTSDLDLDYVVKDFPKLLNSVKLGTERIRKIVLSLRNFSRLDESGLKRIDIHEGLENTLMLLNSRLQGTASRSAISIVKAYERVPPIDCYANQLNQVFMHLLANAIDSIDAATTSASPLDSRQDGHQIVIQTFQESSKESSGVPAPANQRIVVKIINSGPPIPADVVPNMFDPFFTTKAIGKGTGMGLAISYQTIVDLHKGTLTYTPTAEGKTAFTIEIPTVQRT